MKTSTWTGSGLLLLLGAGCGGYKIPASHVNAPPASIAAAERAGADRSTNAAQQLQTARTELDTANRLSQKGDKRRADLMYLRADTDAQIALATAQDDNLSSQARQIQQQIQQLRGSQSEPR